MYPGKRGGTRDARTQKKAEPLISGKEKKKRQDLIASRRKKKSGVEKKRRRITFIQRGGKKGGKKDSTPGKEGRGGERTFPTSSQITGGEKEEEKPLSSILDQKKRKLGKPEARSQKEKREGTFSPLPREKKGISFASRRRKNDSEKRGREGELSKRRFHQTFWEKREIPPRESVQNVSFFEEGGENDPSASLSTKKGRGGKGKRFLVELKREKGTYALLRGGGERGGRRTVPFSPKGSLRSDEPAAERRGGRDHFILKRKRGGGGERGGVCF